MATETTANDAIPNEPPKPLVYPPVTEQRPSSRPILVIAIALVVIFAGVGVLLVHIGLRGSPSTPVATTGGAGPTVSSAPGPAVSSVVSFGPNQVLAATQHVAFSQPVHTLTMTVPKQTARVGGGMFAPRISHLQLLIGSHPPIPVAGTLKPGSDVTVPLPASVTELDLAYIAHGAVQMSAPSSSHRAAALVTTLSVSPATGVSSVTIKGSNVTNIGCFDADGTAQSCGTQTADGWTVMRDSGDPAMAIIAQLDLSP